MHECLKVTSPNARILLEFLLLIWCLAPHLLWTLYENHNILQDRCHDSRFTGKTGIDTTVTMSWLFGFRFPFFPLFFSSQIQAFENFLDFKEKVQQRYGKLVDKFIQIEIGGLTKKFFSKVEIVEMVSKCGTWTVLHMKYKCCEILYLSSFAFYPYLFHNVQEFLQCLI